MEYFESFSYFWIFLASLFSGGVTFFPEEIILLIAGYASSIGFFQLPYVILVCLTGLILSDIILFFLSRNRSPLIKQLRKYAKRLAIMKHPIIEQMNPKWIVFFAKFLPFIRFIGPLYAGVHNIKTSVFISYNILASIVYVMFFTSLGYIFDSELLNLISRIESVRHGIFIFLMFVIGVASVVYLHRLVDRIIDDNGSEQE